MATQTYPFSLRTGSFSEMASETHSTNRMWMKILLGLFILGVAGGTVYYLTQREDDEESDDNSGSPPEMVPDGMHVESGSGGQRILVQDGFSTKPQNMQDATSKIVWELANGGRAIGKRLAVKVASSEPDEPLLEYVMEHWPRLDRALGYPAAVHNVYQMDENAYDMDQEITVPFDYERSPPFDPESKSNDGLDFVVPPAGGRGGRHDSERPRAQLVIVEMLKEDTEVGLVHEGDTALVYSLVHEPISLERVSEWTD